MRRYRVLTVLQFRRQVGVQKKTLIGAEREKTKFPGYERNAAKMGSLVFLRAGLWVFSCASLCLLGIPSWVSVHIKIGVLLRTNLIGSRFVLIGLAP